MYSGFCRFLTFSGGEVRLPAGVAKKHRLEIILPSRRSSVYLSGAFEIATSGFYMNIFSTNVGIIPSSHNTKSTTMNTQRIHNPLRATFKQSALALVAAGGLAIGGAHALTTTETYNLGPQGSGTPISAGVGGFITWKPKEALPAGSIVRSITASIRIDSTVSDSWASDLLIYMDSNPVAPATEGILQIGGDYGGPVGVVAQHVGWAGGDGGPGTTINQTLTAGVDWTGDIDLNGVQLSIGNNYAQSTWSGTITVEYDVTALTVALTSPMNAQAIESGTSIVVTAAVLEPGAFTDTVTFHTTPTSPAGPTVSTVSTDTSTPFSADLGVLPVGSYEIYATVANNNVPPDTATSPIRTFTVQALIPTTIVMSPAGPPTTYGQAVNVSATVSPVPTGGTVQFFAGSNDLGTPVPVNTVTGEASYSTTLLGAGLNAITAGYSGYQTYAASTTAASVSQEVNKAPLTVKALNSFRAPDTPNPDSFSYLITGFLNGQNLASSGVTGAPNLSTSAVLASPAGDYAITCAQGSLDAANYDFIPVNGTLTVAVVADTFSVNFYAYPGWMTDEGQRATIRVPAGVPAGMPGWFTSGWKNVEVPFGIDSPLPADPLTSNQGSSATFFLKDCRNSGVYDGPRTEGLGDGNYHMMDGHVNSTLDGESNKFDMEVTDIPFAVYDVIFYMGANLLQYGDGTGIIKFNGGADRAFTVKPGAFDGSFTEMSDGVTPGNYVVFTGVTGSSFTAQTWGTGTVNGVPGFAHVGPFGFQIREAAVTTGYNAWATANAPGQTPDQDHDNDGADNGIEYFMGEIGSSFTAMPGLNGSNTITWPMNAGYSGTYEVQTSPDLVNWSNVDPRPAPSGGSLSYLLPPGPGKLFVRLMVRPTP
jgi:hypothetical protein